MLNQIALETWSRAKENLKTLYHLRVKNAFEYSAKIPVSVRSQRYEIETVSEFKDLLHLLKIRPNDQFDSKADHVLIRDKKTRVIVGGLRILSSQFSNAFSCESTFDLSPLKQKSIRFLELSKLFLFPEHRHAEMLNLVSSFLSQYSLKDQAEYLICSQSINSGSSRSAVLVHKYFESLNAASPFAISVRPEFLVPNFEHWKGYLRGPLSSNEQEEIELFLPAVLKESLALGATVSAHPALDKIHNRIDFLTILHKEDLNKALWKKSSSHSELSYAYLYS